VSKREGRLAGGRGRALQTRRSHAHAGLELSGRAATVRYRILWLNSGRILTFVLALCLGISQLGKHLKLHRASA
jgi:hypothetical protein